MDFVSTVKGSLLEGFYPAGWDMERIDSCCSEKNRCRSVRAFGTKDSLQWSAVTFMSSTP